MLTHPGTLRIFLLHYLTLGFYFFYWCSRSRTAVNRAARQEIVPTTWLLAVPAANYWWMWKYGQALERVSFGRIKGGDTFLFFLLATYAWTLLSGPFRWVVDFSSLKGGTLVWALVVTGIVLYLAEVTGMAFFCAVTQRRINAVTGTNTTTA